MHAAALLWAERGPRARRLDRISPHGQDQKAGRIVVHHFRDYTRQEEGHAFPTPQSCLALLGTGVAGGAASTAQIRSGVAVEPTARRPISPRAGAGPA